VEHVNPEQLLVQLKTRDLLTREEEYMLMNSNYTSQKRTKLLILQLYSKNPNNYVKLFYECLRDETQHSGHQYLADLLEPNIHEYESQSQATNNSGANDSNVVMTKSEMNDTGNQILLDAGSKNAVSSSRNGE